MASGSFYKSISAYDYRLIVEWSSTPNTAGNSSKVSATAKLYCPYELYISGRSANKFTINGKDYAFTSPAISTAGGTFALGTVQSGDILHNADGTKSLSISCSFALNATINGTYCGTVTASATVKLDDIPRAAVLTAAPDFNDEENPVISYSNPAGNTVTTLQACISLTGSEDDIAYRDIPKTGNSYTFTLTEAERAVLRNATTTANSRKVFFYIKTILNGETYYSKLSKTLEIVNALPTMSPQVSDNGTVSKTLTGDTNTVIRGYNTIAYAFNASAEKGATITDYLITCGSKTGKAASGSLGIVYSSVFDLSVTDSRGNTARQTIAKGFIDYVSLTCNLTVTAPTTGGVMSLTVSGNYYNGSFGAVNNTLTVQMRYKVEGGSYTAWSALTPTKTGNTYTASGSVSGLDYTKSYTVQARALDAIYNASTEPAIESPERTVRAKPVFDWGKDNFNINGTLRLNDNIAMYRNSAGALLLGANGTMYFRPKGVNSATGEMRIDSSGNQFVSGKVTAKGGLVVGSRAHGAKTLWTGAYFMNAAQTITLSEAVSLQPHGLVLVFSVYSSSTAQDYGFNSFFVSKEEIAAHLNKAHVFFMSTSGAVKVAVKNLFINDTTITGYDENAAGASATSSGLTTTNNHFVLRRVVGV